ncbi:MAG: 50S ribosomal protein L23 [Planctomycetes bacterium]|nr:50S ribosomal protein L23 [Planctomycetota bacterium]
MADPTRYYHVIRRPVLTEKSNKLQEIRNQYFFEVHPKTNKCEVKKAVETLFDVKVARVNILNVPSKIRRFMGRPGRTAEWKKAVVTLRPGQTIDLT